MRYDLCSFAHLYFDFIYFFLFFFWSTFHWWIANAHSWCSFLVFFFFGDKKTDRDRHAESRQNHFRKSWSFASVCTFRFGLVHVFISKNVSCDGWHMTLCYILLHIVYIIQFVWRILFHRWTYTMTSSKNRKKKNENIKVEPFAVANAQNNKVINSYRALTGRLSISATVCKHFYCASRAWMQKRNFFLLFSIVCLARNEMSKKKKGKRKREANDV